MLRPMRIRIRMLGQMLWVLSLLVLLVLDRAVMPMAEVIVATWL